MLIIDSGPPDPSPIFLLPEKLRGGLVLRRKQGPGAENVFQELYGQVLQVMVTIKILKIRNIENPNLKILGAVVSVISS